MDSHTRTLSLQWANRNFWSLDLMAFDVMIANSDFLSHARLQTKAIHTFYHISVSRKNISWFLFPFASSKPFLFTHTTDWSRKLRKLHSFGEKKNCETKAKLNCNQLIAAIFKFLFRGNRSIII